MSNSRLIEEWLPIKEIGVECQLDKSIGSTPRPSEMSLC